MITKERLEELIKQETTIYGITYDKEILKINTKYLHHPKEFGTKKEILDMLSCCYENENGTNVFNVEYSNVYETKEEAEFVAKNNDTRVEKFEPPFKLDLFDAYEFFSKYYGYVSIIHSDKDYHIFDQNDCVDDHFKTYQEAVNYAHKLFKGDKE